MCFVLVNPFTAGLLDYSPPVLLGVGESLRLPRLLLTKKKQTKRQTNNDKKKDKTKKQTN